MPNAADIGLAVAEAAGAIVFASVAGRLWRADERAVSLACWLLACAALGLSAYSAALGAGPPA